MSRVATRDAEGAGPDPVVPSRRRSVGARAAAGAGLVATLLAGCATSDWATSGGLPPEPVAATSAPAPPRPRVPVVQVRDATLRSAATPAPPPVPVRLQVPGVGIDMAVDPVGVTADGEMALPEDADRAGWYEFGASPGDPAGSTVVAAHVDSWQTGIGPFAELRSVAVGSPLTVTTADGVAHDYTVDSVRKIPKEGAPVPEWFDRTGPPRLTLVTCGGRWRADVGHYTDNLVVTASPVVG